MTALEFFMGLICTLFLLEFIYAVIKRPFLNDYKRSFWKTANGLCILVLGILSYVYFQKENAQQAWYLAIIVLTVIMGLISTHLLDEKFNSVMYGEIHLFRLTSWQNNKVRGTLAIHSTKETVEARLVCPLYADYHYGEIIPVRVLLCHPNEIIVEPAEN